MKTAVFGYFLGALFVASAAAHALAGWPPFNEVLVENRVDEQIIGALTAGWLFGSACMVAFAGMVIQQAVRRNFGWPVQSGALWCICITYVLFGISAFVFRDFNPHFLFFVLSGLLVGVFAILGASRQVIRDSAVEQRKAKG